MGKEILYSDGADDICYELDHWEELLENEDIEELELEEMVEDKNDDIRWCTYYGEYLENKDTCGKHCKPYEPQNGVRGKCKYKTFCLIGSGNKFLLTKDGFNKIQKTKLPFSDALEKKL